MSTSTQPLDLARDKTHIGNGGSEEQQLLLGLKSGCAASSGSLSHHAAGCTKAASTRQTA